MERKLGDKLKAQEITGRNLQLFTKHADIKWAVETHAPKYRGVFTGVIMTGNEDCPDEMWVTGADEPNHIDTVYTLVCINGEGMIRE